MKITIWKLFYTFFNEVFQCAKMMLLPLLAVLVSLPTIYLKSLSMNTNRALGQFSSLNKQGIQRSIDSRCLDCICEKESGCNHNIGCIPAPDDAHQACGAFQIHQSYFQACCGFLGLANCNSDSAWRSCALDYNCATRCVTVCETWESQLSYNRYLGLCKSIWAVMFG